MYRWIVWYQKLLWSYRLINLCWNDEALSLYPFGEFLYLKLTGIAVFQWGSLWCQCMMKYSDIFHRWFHNGYIMIALPICSMYGIFTNTFTIDSSHSFRFSWSMLGYSPYSEHSTWKWVVGRLLFITCFLLHSFNQRGWFSSLQQENCNQQWVQRQQKVNSTFLVSETP